VFWMDLLLDETIVFPTDILLHEIIEHVFHFVKMEINRILNLLKRLTKQLL
jgi:hypothetical protein